MMSEAVMTLQRQGNSLLEEVSSLVVLDQESAAIASGYRQAVKGYLKRVEELTAPVIQATKQAVAAAMAQREGLRQPGVTAQTTLDQKLLAYDREVARQRAEAQRLAEEERQRLVDEAKLQAALDAEANGHPGQAEAILAAPEPPMPVLAPPAAMPEPAKTEGVWYRSTWEAHVVDFRALVQAWLDGKVPELALLPGQVALNDLARAKRSVDLGIPGVIGVEKRSVAGRAG
jgi:hypothetical protein